MASKKTLEFTAKNVKAFTAWLKKFSIIDNSLLLEIDETTSTFIAKTYNTERSVVKMSTIAFDEAGLLTKGTKEPKRIKVGIFNIPRLIKIIDQFSEMEFTIIVNYQELVGDDKITNFAAETLEFKNKSLKMSTQCTSLKVFKYIPDDLFMNTIAKMGVLGTFELVKANIEKINSLCAIDNDHKFIEFKFKDNEVVVSGKTFELTICEIGRTATTLSVFKNQYANIDIENYNVDLGEDRLVFKSKDSDTVCVLSMTTDTE